MAKSKDSPKGEGKGERASRGGGARPMWSGSISFGLVQIPVGLLPSEVSHELSFKQLDKRDMKPVRYQRVNGETGKLVPWGDIVRGYERSKGEMIVVTDEDLRRANVAASQTIEILDFVDAGSVDPPYFDRPYYIAPLQSGKRAAASAKAYALLRDALQRTGKIGIAKVVLRTREHLAAVIPHDKVMILNLLRFDHELRKEEDAGLPEEALAAAQVGARELEMAERLIEEMASKWEPARYKDEYRDDVLALIERKAKAGEALEVPEPEEAAAPQGPAADLLELLRKSLGGHGPANRVTKQESGKAATAGAPSAKKGAAHEAASAKKGANHKAAPAKKGAVHEAASAKKGGNHKVAPAKKEGGLRKAA